MTENLNPNVNNEIGKENDIVEEQMPIEVKEKQADTQDEAIVRLGRISAFGPSLDGGFGIND